MGKRDLTGKEFFADRERFAELLNAVLYHGKNIIRAEELEQMIRTYPSFSGKGEMIRDLFMKDKKRNVCYGLELETESDYINAEMFETDLREFFQAMQCRNDKEKLWELWRTERFRNLKEEAIWTIAVYLDQKRLMPKIREGKLDMCKAIEDIFEDGKAEGLEIGIEKGRGSILRNMIQQGLDEEFICRITGCSKQEFASASEG